MGVEPLMPMLYPQPWRYFKDDDHRIDVALELNYATRLFHTAQERIKTKPLERFHDGNKDCTAELMRLKAKLYNPVRKDIEKAGRLVLVVKHIRAQIEKDQQLQRDLEKRLAALRKAPVGVGSPIWDNWRKQLEEEIENSVIEHEYDPALDKLLPDVPNSQTNSDASATVSGEKPPPSIGDAADDNTAGEPIDPNADLVIYADDLVAPAGVTDDHLVAPAPATGDDLVIPVAEGWSNKKNLLVGGGVALATVGGLGALKYVMRDLEKDNDFTWKKTPDATTLGCGALAATALVGGSCFRHKIVNFFSNLFGYGDVCSKPEDAEESTVEGASMKVAAAAAAVKRVT